MAGHLAPDGRTGPFWDLVTGRVDPPPIAALLGFELTQGDVVVATATATALIRG